MMNGRETVCSIMCIMIYFHILSYTLCIMARQFVWNSVFVLTGICSVNITGLRIWDMSQYCSQDISTDDVAGELHFDANSLYSHRSESECTVTIRPTSIYIDQLNLYYNVLVNFTEFNLGQDCVFSNLTLFDGSTTSNSIVEGSAASMCGVNETLVNRQMALVAKEGTVTIRYRWTKEPDYYYGHSFPARFALKFNSIDAGSCESDEHVKQCSNHRCIRSDTYCTAEINGCGYTGNECEEENSSTLGGTERVEALLRNIVSFIAENSWIIVAVIGACVFFLFLRRARSDPNSRLRQIPVLNKCCPPQNTLNNSRDLDDDYGIGQLVSEPINDHSRSQIERQSLTENIISTNSPSGHTVDRDDNSLGSSQAEYESSNTAAPPPSLSSAPPPSYEEVMAPSYNDVMANEDRYRHT